MGRNRMLEIMTKMDSRKLFKMIEIIIMTINKIMMKNHFDIHED